LRILGDPTRIGRPRRDLGGNRRVSLGPFDIQGATPLTDGSLYVGKLVRDPSGALVLLAFHNIGPDGQFGGVLSEPMPVRWNGDTLVVATGTSTPMGSRTPAAAGFG